jgi:hypothetical protein
MVLLNLLSGVVNSMEGLSSGGQILSLLCLTIVTITFLYKTKKQNLFIKKAENEKGLDDYSYRDLFHFFINEEFHIDKYHLAKGFD